MDGEEGVFCGLYGHGRLAVALEGAEFVRAEVVLFVVVKPGGDIAREVEFREFASGSGSFAFGIRRDRPLVSQQVDEKFGRQVICGRFGVVRRAVGCGFEKDAGKDQRESPGIRKKFQNPASNRRRPDF